MAKKCCVLILAATIVALALRLPRLRQRPMHGDEAVHADKFGELLEDGVYTYDPYEYHGPTLNYLTLIPARLSSAGKLAEVSEFTLRIVPVFFGVSLVLLVLLIGRGLGSSAAVIAAVLTAISPAMVFYSRYYIQEILLVSFTFGAIVFGYRYGYRYTQSRKITWAVLTGMCMGLMHATKETCIIAYGSMFLAVLVVLLMERPKGSIVNAVKWIKPSHILVFLAAGAVNTDGILDSVRTYTTYFDRAGNNTVHIHPWYYYIKILLYSRFFYGPRWSEALIVLLALVGFVAAMTKKGISSANIHLVRFLGFYTLILTVVYSLIPYKTPWCMLGFLHGMILLAGVGAVVLVKLLPNVIPRLIILLLIFESSVFLSWQAYRSNYKYYSDSRNPYVYAHPTDEVFTVVKRIEEMARVHPDGYKMHIQVICPGKDFWPLPWYLRRFEYDTIEWWESVDNDAASAPLIIASDFFNDAATTEIYTLTPFE
ncbi:MAG: flippase activity-associated protein Agl23, partial [Planctomycetota bacterium]